MANIYICALIAAAALDVVANLLLARSDGFKRKGYGLGAMVLVLLAFSALAFATRGMDLAVAYAMWGGFGIIGTSLGGWALLGQRMCPSAWLGVLCLISGMGILHWV